VVRILEVDEPTIKDNDVLVRVRAMTVDRTDCACRAAKAFLMALFTLPGHEPAPWAVS
jgi:NADPH:quinone reductase-like Zn-dependent oxidoreductase